MAFEIEKGIPVKGQFRSRYPFQEMEPNDSFFVPCDEDKRKMTASNLSASARRYCQARGGGRRYSVRKVDGGVRCWRVE